ncbi:hypothetical protein F441_21829 [Phytophthora nicotianae CJ01A1]|uniref:Uncharacterized protein n=1 Tax=Phytophthora nicotianae CJ01A1 TaxID=1317063 RepID=W2VRJ1_PHYNI|nr:hypothetical protein F441_21829 [Phytophthora nicotianae CJ01A1]
MQLEPWDVRRKRRSFGRSLVVGLKALETAWLIICTGVEPNCLMPLVFSSVMPPNFGHHTVRRRGGYFSKLDVALSVELCVVGYHPQQRLWQWSVNPLCRVCRSQLGLERLRCLCQTRVGIDRLAELNNLEHTRTQFRRIHDVLVHNLQIDAAS